MDIRPAGPGGTGAPVPDPLRSGLAGRAHGPVPKQDAGPAMQLDAGLVRAIAERDMARLIEILDPLPAQSAAHVNDDIRTAVAAVARSDDAGALATLEEAVRFDPRAIDSVRAEPGLERIRRDVEALMHRMTEVARLDAETKLGHAMERPATRLPGWDTPPDALARVAQALIDSGGYVNYLRAAELSLMLIEASSPARPLARPWTGLERRRRSGRPPGFRVEWPRVLERVQIVWQRAPLLVLLVGWLAVGLVGGGISAFFRPRFNFPFGLWGLGFLAIVLYGFYMRVRNIRF